MAQKAKSKKKKKDELDWFNARRKVSDLKPFADNPRMITAKEKRELKESFKKYNYVEPIVINADDTILAGHQRVKTLQDLGRGEEEIDVRMPTKLLTEADFREYNIRSNLNGGSWVFEMLLEKNAFADLVKWGFDPGDIGFDSSTPKVKIGELGDMKYQILIECEDERQQTRYIEFLEKENIKCRPLIL